MKIYRNVFVS